MQFQKRKMYTRDEIQEWLGGSKWDFLPSKGGQIVCGCFRTDTNPDAPQIILAGCGTKREKAADLLENQKTTIPVFLKRATNAWEYVGDFKLKRRAYDSATITEYTIRSKGGAVHGILFLEEIS